MFEINGTLAIFVLSFLIFMKLLDEIMLKPVGRVLEQRNACIKSNQDAGIKARTQAQSIIQGYEQKLEAVRTKSHGIINVALEEANRYRQQDLTGMHQEGLRQVEKAKATLNEECKQAFEGLVDHETELVQMITSKVLGEKIELNLDRQKVHQQLQEVS